MIDEPNSTDDAVIGRALRRSILIAMIVAAVVGLGYAATLWNRPSVKTLDPVSLGPRPRKLDPKVAPPVCRFTQITASAGIDFVHHSGVRGEKLVPEVMGGGVAFLDYDNDGRPDLLLVDSASVSLYHNDGKCHFSNVTAGSGLSIPFYGMGVAVGDYDNDGLVDILITGVGGCRLFHNDGDGHFHDVTLDAGLGGDPTDWYTSASFVDVDNDGKLDLFICNYYKWTRELDLKATNTLTGIGRAVSSPPNFPGSFNRLYHNDGNGHFSDISHAAGIEVRNKDTGVPSGKGLGVACVDIDADGLIDLIVGNDGVQNFVFHNKGKGFFEEVGVQYGMAFDSNGYTRGSMGIDAGWFANNQSLAVTIGTFSRQMTSFYVWSQKPGITPLFTDDSIVQNIGFASFRPMKFGVTFLDYDLDGWIDLLCADGHLEPEISKMSASESYPQSAQLFWNAGGHGGPFSLTTAAQVGSDILKPIVGRACAYADIDGDGDLDVILTQIDGPPLLLRNDQHTGHHYLRFKLIGKLCNRDAIGAMVIVHAGGQTQRRLVMPTHGYLSQSELPVTFGLGDLTRPDSVEIHWPGGDVQHVSDYQVDGITRIEQNAGQ